MIVGQSSSICLTDRIFLQMHATFCEYLVFKNLEVTCTLAKYLEQEGITNLLFVKVLYTQSSQILKQSH